MPSKFGAGGATEMKEEAELSPFARTVRLNDVLKDEGDTCFLRFIHDHEANSAYPHIEAWLTIRQHGGVPTRPKPDWIDDDKGWPPRMGVVCRHHRAKGVKGAPPLYSIMPDSEIEECYPCDRMKNKEGKSFRATPRGWAIAVLREEVVEDGEIIGYADKTRVVDRDGKEVEEKAFVICNMGWNNFFTHLKNYGEHYGTVLDRDYKITRTGKDKDTKYGIIPVDPLPAPKGSEFKHFDLRDPVVFERYADCPYDLDEEIMAQAEWNWHRRWFDPSYTPPKRDADEKGAPAAEQTKPKNDAEEADVGAMASRIKGYTSPTAEGNGNGAEADDDEDTTAENDTAASEAEEAAKPKAKAMRNIE
jgi:hypothetical protein